MDAVRFTTYDDVELAANLYLPAAGKEWARGIIVCHGFGSNKEEHAPFGESAASHGYAALIMDLRGHGESGGVVDANIFNDVAAALLYLQNRPEVNPMSVAIRGSSMGGWLAVHTAAHLADIAPVIAYCPNNEMTLLTLLEEMAGVNKGHTSPLITSVTSSPPRVDVDSAAQLVSRLDVSRAAHRISPRSLLLVHCEGDQIVPSHISQRIYDTAREPKTLWMLPGGDHSFAQHDPATTERVMEWLSAGSKQ